MPSRAPAKGRKTPISQQVPAKPTSAAKNSKKKAQPAKRQPSPTPIKAKKKQRQRQAKQAKAGSSNGKVTKATIEQSQDAEEDAANNTVSFSDLSNLPSPEAGPSRLPISTPSSFTPLGRSVLAGLSHRALSPSKSPSPPANDNDLDIVIDTEPATATQVPQVSEHFDPPPLFSATLDTAITTAAADKKSEEGPTSTDQSTGGLLLPSHVVLDGTEPGEASENRPGDHAMEGLHFVDDNISKGVQRYFVPEATEEDNFLANADQSRICSKCKRPGHRQWDCPHIICTICGAEDEHERRDCPHGLICFGCGQRGHRQSDCPDPASRYSKKRGCDRCGSRDHPEGTCPTLWRVYAYWSAGERKDVQEKKRKAEGWEKEAIGGMDNEHWCYNCAKEGHLGDDCPRGRASNARLFFPSAFSHAMSSRGPFYTNPSARSTATPTHARWDDDDEASLPYVTPGFAGENAGKKSREKAKRAMIDREKNGAVDDVDDWFARKRGTPVSHRGRGKSTPNPRISRPWDSDSRPTQGRRDPPREHLPFSHSHLLASAPASARGKTISFGKLSLPNSGGTDSPTADKARNGKRFDSSKGLLSQALHNSKRDHSDSNAGSNSPRTPLQDTPTSSRKRRKQKNDDDMDLESQWWSSGKAGGKVTDWDKDLPSPSANNAKSKSRKADMLGKTNKGQQYTGGY